MLSRISWASARSMGLFLSFERISGSRCLAGAGVLVYAANYDCLCCFLFVA